MTTVQRDVGRFAGGFGVVAATCAAVLCRCPDHRVHTGGNYGIIPTFQPSTFGRTYTAYGGIFVVASLLWGWWADGNRPDTPDAVGAGVCLSASPSSCTGHEPDAVSR